MKTFVHKDNPCKKDCAGRSATCHSTCEKYAKYYQGRREQNKRSLMILTSLPRTGDNMTFKKDKEVGRFKKPDKTRRG